MADERLIDPQDTMVRYSNPVVITKRDDKGATKVTIWILGPVKMAHPLTKLYAGILHKFLLRVSSSHYLSATLDLTGLCRSTMIILSI